MRIVFMGTPAFAVPALSTLLNAEHEVLAVVTQPDRRGNRGKVVFSPIKQVALDAGLPVMQPNRIKNEPDFIEDIKKLEPDIVIVAAFGQLLPPEFLEIPKFGCVNIHASLLPKHRGAAPIQRAILDGDDKTGVTIMQMAKGLDTGDMICKTEIEIGCKDVIDLTDELANSGAELLLTALRAIESGTATFEPQCDSESSYAPIIKKTDGLTDFSASSQVEERKLRAYKEWPSLHSYHNGNLIKFYEAQIVDLLDESLEPGTVADVNTDGFIVKCGTGALRITEVQLQGKRKMSVADFLRGYKIAVGDRFVTI